MSCIKTFYLTKIKKERESEKQKEKYQAKKQEQKQQGVNKYKEL